MASSSRPPVVQCHGLRLSLRLIQLVIAMPLLTAPVAAQTTSTYTGAAGDQWSNPSNWTPPGVPNNNPFQTFDVNLGPNIYVFQDIDATINDLNFIRSTLKGPAGTDCKLTLDGDFYWEDAVHVGPGTTIVNGQTTLLGFANTLNGRRLVLNGNSNINADLTMQNGATVVIHGDATFGIRTDLLGPNSTFVNNGRVFQAGTSNVNQIESVWQQGPDGQLNLRRTLGLLNDSTHSGEIILGSSGTLELRANTISLPTVHTFEPGSTIEGAGTILVQGFSATNKATAHFNGTINRSAGIFRVRDAIANVNVTGSTMLGNTIDLRPNGTFNVTLLDSGGDDAPVFNLPTILVPSGGGAIFTLQAEPGLERPVQIHIPELNQSFGAGTYRAALPQGSSLIFENWEQLGRAILDVREVLLESLEHSQPYLAWTSAIHLAGSPLAPLSSN